MSTTLSKGVIKPASPDTGDDFFPALAANAQLQNDHVHDGVTGAILTSSQTNIAAGSWAASPIAGGSYRQTITLPAGYSYSTCVMEFRLSTGEVVYPTIERISATQYYIYTNDNSLAYVANYR
jgi:hypothetical protein